MSVQRVPLFSRKRDLAYFINFCIGIPITFMMDLQAIYPASMVPSFMKSLETFYITTYHDQFFINPPPFFKTFMWSELLFQAPVMIWAVFGLYHNSPKVPIILLPFATLIFITTVTCMVEYWSWNVPVEHKVELTKLYGPYAAVSAFMGLDMFLRLNGMINRLTAATTTRKLL